VKGFKTLFWLEAHRSGVWALGLLGSLAPWAWGIYQARGVEAGERAEVHGILLVIAGVIGTLVLALMIGRLRGETRGGQYQVLLLTPASGFAHLAARLAFALAVALTYYVALGALACWAVAQTGVALGTGDAIRLALAFPLYILAVGVAPALAWTLLLMTFTSAYRVSGPTWIPGTVMIIGSVLAARWLVSGIARLAYRLPSWPLFTGLALPDSDTAVVTVERGGREIVTAAAGTPYLPQEPVWIGLALAALLLVLAGRVWREVEA
jgi:hypothetical protein